MKRIKHYVTDNRIELLMFMIVAVCFYVQLINAGIATHDELINIYRVRIGELFSTLTWERWGMELMNLLPSYIHATCVSQSVYRIFTMVGVLCSCVAFSWLLSKQTGKKLYWLFLILFFLLAQIELDHDGLFAFSFSYQINTCYVFAGLALYADYIKSRKNIIKIISAALYLMSSMAYEAFILYGVLFFIMDLKCLSEERRITLKNLFNACSITF